MNRILYDKNQSYKSAINLSYLVLLAGLEICSMSIIMRFYTFDGLCFSRCSFQKEVMFFERTTCNLNGMNLLKGK